MSPKQFTLITGLIFTGVGILALVPSFSTFPAGYPRLALETSYGAFLNLFPMNIVNKIALIVTGIAGVACANAPTTSLPKCIHFARFCFVSMGTVAILGFIPATNTLFGYWPLFGASALAAAIISITSAYFGYALSSRAKRRADTIPEYHETRKAG
jgi:uncharacterized membrane protein